MKNILKQNNLYCTGCTACVNGCAKSAIRMEPDEEGFYMAVIDPAKCIQCGRCEAICPQLHPKFENQNDPLCYAAMASEDIRMKSSSGGVFPLLAEQVIQNGGYVCGAAYDLDFKGVSHKLISKREEIAEFRGSKYVYSKMGNCFRQIREILTQGKQVLFSGCPCQVAGLKNYLGRDYDGLITVDIMCAGIPSEKVFRAYVEEVSDGRQITEIRFRPKEYGWEYSGIHFQFSDGSEYMIHSVRDPYLVGFMKFLYKSHACESCQYAPVPRQGDITIGDFWHIAKFAPELDTSKGISACLLNSDKGEKLFRRVEDKLDMLKEMPLSFFKRFNQFGIKRKAHLGRSRFFYLLNDRKFSVRKAIDYALNWKFDVAIMGCWTVSNYGGELTYYALYQTIRELGYEVIMVERRIDLPNYNVPEAKGFAESPYPFYDICRIHKTFDDQRELNLRVTNFVLGSDQIWNIQRMALNKESLGSYSLDFVADWRKRIAYAASFGTSEFKGNKEDEEFLRELIQKFDYVSVREEDGSRICKKHFQVEAEQVLDPVFLCNPDYYKGLASKSTVKLNGDFVYAYTIWPDRYKLGLDKAAELLNSSLISVVNLDRKLYKHNQLEKWPYMVIENAKIEDWMYYFINCRFVVTDSFHGLCMAIIFKKPFLYIKGSLDLSRPRSILEPLGLQYRIVESVNDALKHPDQYFSDIDYIHAYEVLDKERERCLNWLKEAQADDKKVRS